MLGCPANVRRVFVCRRCGQIGNVGRNTYRGPHGFYSDMALAKTFNITERYKAQFRFDAYNVFNHPVLAFSAIRVTHA